MADLHIVCLRPGGMNRGGMRHVGHARHSAAQFTPEQMRELVGEPDLVLIAGGERLTPAHLDAKAAAPGKKV